MRFVIRSFYLHWGEIVWAGFFHITDRLHRFLKIQLISAFTFRNKPVPLPMFCLCILPTSPIWPYSSVLIYAGKNLQLCYVSTSRLYRIGQRGRILVVLIIAIATNISCCHTISSKVHSRTDNNQQNSTRKQAHKNEIKRYRAPWSIRTGPTWVLIRKFGLRKVRTFQNNRGMFGRSSLIFVNLYMCAAWHISR